MLPLLRARSFLCTTRRQFSNWTWEKNVGKQTPQFSVTPYNGFLPRQNPLVKLPPRFAALESLLQRMPVTLSSGSPGLLGTGDFGDAVLKELPLYDVKDVQDSRLLMALFRDYTFAASAYLLEPCDIVHRQRREFGPGRSVLPKNITIPLLHIADKIGASPFMEYAQSYALYNYKKKDASGPIAYDNLQLIRTFSGMPSESGFILVHVDMVSQTPHLVGSIMYTLEAAHRNDRFSFEEYLADSVRTMQGINEKMEKMWKRSAPSDYLKFRTFILGTKNQKDIFPDGVIYEGSEDERPRTYRGESGANDSIIPTCDNLLQLTGKMPKNEMTEILKDFRSYRPADHSRWLTWVQSSAYELGIEKYCEETPRSLALYIMLLEQVREFRARHWNFAKEYIIKRTSYPTATGGSPMATWLPNQLDVILQTLEEKCDLLRAKHGMLKNGVPSEEYANKIAQQRRQLAKEVEKIKGGDRRV